MKSADCVELELVVSVDGLFTQFILYLLLKLDDNHKTRLLLMQFHKR